MTLKEQLDKTYWNLHPIIRRNISRDKFSSFSELQEIGKRIELEQSRLKIYRPPPAIEDVFCPLAAYRPPNSGQRKFQRNTNVQAIVENDTANPKEKTEIASTSKKITTANNVPVQEKSSIATKQNNSKDGDNNRKRFTGKCYNCGKDGHMAKYCKTPFCQKCGELDTETKDCKACQAVKELGNDYVENQ